jgi:hypothetical protein
MGIGIEIDASLTGDKKTAAALRKLKKNAPDAVMAAIIREAAAIFKASQSQVPHDTGRLKGSGLVSSRGKFDIFISYNTPYAARIHNDTKLDRGRAARGDDRRSLYLEQPYAMALSGMEKRLANRARGFIGSGKVPSQGSMLPIIGTRSR